MGKRREWMGRTDPSNRNLSRTSMRWGEVNRPVWKPQLRRIDSVKVHVDPYKSGIEMSNWHNEKSEESWCGNKKDGKKKKEWDGKKERIRERTSRETRTMLLTVCIFVSTKSICGARVNYGWKVTYQILDALLTALIKARAAARFAGGRGSVLLIQARDTTKLV